MATRPVADERLDSTKPCSEPVVVRLLCAQVCRSGLSHGGVWLREVVRSLREQSSCNTGHQIQLPGVLRTQLSRLNQIEHRVLQLNQSRKDLVERLHLVVHHKVGQVAGNLIQGLR